MENFYIDLDPVPVFDRDNRYTGIDVEIVTNLDDFETGDDGFSGVHAGITKLPDGRYVFMRTSQWEGDTNWGDVVTPAEALWLILDRGHEELLQQEEFKDLEFQVRNTLLVPRPGQILPRYLIH